MCMGYVVGYGELMRCFVRDMFVGGRKNSRLLVVGCWNYWCCCCYLLLLLVLLLLLLL